MSDEIDALPFSQKYDRNVLVLGTVGAGKTTAIKSLSDSFIIDENIKSQITDRGKIKISSNESLFLYAIDGVIFSESIWKYLKNELIGTILLIDNRRKDPLMDLERLLLNLSSDDRKQSAPNQLVIGITHYDSSRTPAISDFHSYLQDQDLFYQQKNPPIFSVDTRNFRDTSLLLQALLYTLDSGLNCLLSKEKDYS